MRSVTEGAAGEAVHRLLDAVEQFTSRSPARQPSSERLLAAASTAQACMTTLVAVREVDTGRRD